MSQCTHIIVFDSSSQSLPSSFTSFPQVRLLGESWLDACLRCGSCVNETSYLLRPINDTDGTLFLFI